MRKFESKGYQLKGAAARIAFRYCGFLKRFLNGLLKCPYAGHRG